MIVPDSNPSPDQFQFHCNMTESMINRLCHRLTEISCPPIQTWRWKRTGAKTIEVAAEQFCQGILTLVVRRGRAKLVRTK
jgi:hypothetical protein